jgi:hypothetical protein
MKRKFFVLIFALSYLSVSAQEINRYGSHFFCTEGKRWNYILFNVENEDSPKVPYSYVVRGDTIVGDIAYKKIYFTTSVLRQKWGETKF